MANGGAPSFGPTAARRNSRPVLGESVGNTRAVRRPTRIVAGGQAGPWPPDRTPARSLVPARGVVRRADAAQRADRTAPWSSRAVASRLRHLVCLSAVRPALVLLTEHLPAEHAAPPIRRTADPGSGAAPRPPLRPRRVSGRCSWGLLLARAASSAPGGWDRRAGPRGRYAPRAPPRREEVSSAGGSGRVRAPELRQQSDLAVGERSEPLAQAHVSAGLTEDQLVEDLDPEKLAGTPEGSAAGETCGGGRVRVPP